jgi:hypothetical protein
MVLAIAITSVVIAVTVAPMVLNQAFAAKTTTCSQGPPGPCGGNSDENNKNRCETTKAGEGQGGGEIKSSTC